MADKLISFHADWCGPCDQQEPIIDSIEESTDVTVEHYDIDDDEDMAVANEFNVRSVPTTVLLDENGDVVEQFTGLTEEETIVEAL